MDESDDDQNPGPPESAWPKGLIEKVAISIAIANYGGNFARYYEGQKGSLRCRAAVIIAAVERTDDQSDKGLHHSVREKVAIKYNGGGARHYTDYFWSSVTAVIISDIKRAFNLASGSARL